MSEQQPFSEPTVCERCRAWGCPSAIACGDCYQVKIEKLQKRVCKLEEGIRKHKLILEGTLPVGPSDRELWKLIEKQEGGGEGDEKGSQKDC